MNNRGAMGGTNVPAAAPPATGPGAMIPDGAMGMVTYLHLLFVHTLEMRIMLFPLLRAMLLKLKLVRLPRPVA